MVEIKMIPVDKIRPNPFQPRETFDKEKLEELAESIKESGLLQPILVRKDGDTYEIIAGERRWRAAVLAGLKEIPAIIKEPRPDDIEAMELSLIENWHRQNLNSVETERFIYKLWENGKKTGRYKSISDMAKKLGIPAVTLRAIIHAYEDRQKLYKEHDKSMEQLSYVDFRETEILKDKPELRKQVLELRAKGKLTAASELRQFSKIIKEYPELAEYAIKLKEKGKTIEEIERSVKFIAAQPEEIRQEFIEAGIEIETPITHEIKIEIPEETIKELKVKVEEMEKKIEEITASPEFKEKERLRKNWLAHTAILSNLGDAFCPICGADWRNLRWVCHDLDLQKAQALAAEMFQKAIEKDKGKKRKGGR